MPYITEERRQFLANAPESEIAATDLTTGDLNYLITTLLDEWLQDKGLNYDAVNSAVGVLECAKLELYRRIAAPYEDKKIELNGDVYECNLNK
jgi:hypothetical protein